MSRARPAPVRRDRACLIVWVTDNPYVGPVVTIPTRSVPVTLGVYHARRVRTLFTRLAYALLSITPSTVFRARCAPAARSPKLTWIQLAQSHRKRARPAI